MLPAAVLPVSNWPGELPFGDAPHKVLLKEFNTHDLFIETLVSSGGNWVAVSTAVRDRSNAFKLQLWSAKNGLSGSPLVIENQNSIMDVSPDGHSVMSRTAGGSYSARSPAEASQIYCWPMPGSPRSTPIVHFVPFENAFVRSRNFNLQGWNFEAASFVDPHHIVIESDVDGVSGWNLSANSVQKNVFVWS